MPVAELLEARGHAGEREIARVAAVDLIPRKRRRDARLRGRTHRVRGSDGAILCVLVVVDEDAVALFLPPLARGELRRPALHVAGERQSGAAHLVEGPAPLDARADVHAARARGLRPANEVEIVEGRFDNPGHLPYLVPFNSRDWVEVHT